MDFSLSDEQQAFVDSARAFSDGVLAPGRRAGMRVVFPKEALAAAGELGFMGMYTPEAAGGLALSRLDASLIVEELARGCTTTAAFLTIHNMATSMIGRYCSEAVIESGAPDLVMGSKAGLLLPDGARAPAPMRPPCARAPSAMATIT
jgi:alkylation response protein AidB-like acyl-CoA dehydrogenase